MPREQPGSQPLSRALFSALVVLGLPGIGYLLGLILQIIVRGDWSQQPALHALVSLLGLLNLVIHALLLTKDDH